jgi:hypothetical protein
MKRIIAAVCLVLLALPAVDARAERKENRAQAKANKTARINASIARQLRIKRQLRAASQGSSLAEMVDHNRKSWEKLTPDQKSQFRQYAKAFLEKSPKEQARLLKHYEKLIKMTAEKRAAYRRRAVWLKKVVATLNDQQKQQLQQMTPQQRAAELIRLRDQLVEEGRIKLPEAKADKPAQARPDES